MTKTGSPVASYLDRFQNPRRGEEEGSQATGDHCRPKSGKTSSSYGIALWSALTRGGNTALVWEVRKKPEAIDRSGAWRWAKKKTSPPGLGTATSERRMGGDWKKGKG